MQHFHVTRSLPSYITGNSNWSNHITFLETRAKVFLFIIVTSHIIQICSGVTRGRVLNGELFKQNLIHAQRLHVNLSAFVSGIICGRVLNGAFYAILIN